MKLIACCVIYHGGVRLAAGDAFEVTDHSAAKLIARGAAKAAPKAKKKKAVKAEE